MNLEFYSKNYTVYTFKNLAEFLWEADQDKAPKELEDYARQFFEEYGEGDAPLVIALPVKKLTFQGSEIVFSSIRNLVQLLRTSVQGDVKLEGSIFKLVTDAKEEAWVVTAVKDDIVYLHPTNFKYPASHYEVDIKRMTCHTVSTTEAGRGEIRG